MGITLNQRPAPGDAALNIDHPEQWLADTVSIAKADAYAAPFDTSTKDVDPSTITPAYHAKALQDVQNQIFIAGWRLSAILNNALKNWSGA